MLDPEFPVTVAAGRADGPLPAHRLGAPARAGPTAAAAERALDRGRPGRPGRRPLRHAVRRPAPAGAAGPGDRPGGRAAAARRAVQRRRRARRPDLLLDVLAELRAAGCGRGDVHPRPAPSPTSRATTVCLLNRHQVALRPHRRGAHPRAAARDLRRQRRRRWRGDGTIVAQPTDARCEPAARPVPAPFMQPGAGRGAPARRRSAASSACTCCCAAWRSSRDALPAHRLPRHRHRLRCSAGRCSSAPLAAARASTVVLLDGAHPATAASTRRRPGRPARLVLRRRRGAGLAGRRATQPT